MVKIAITNEKAGKRLDKFLSEEFFSLSRGELVRQIKRGNVLVNGKRTKPSYALSSGEELELDFPIEKNELIPNAAMSLEIIFEDENILAINKPAGIQMHPSAAEKENTVANWLIARYPEMGTVQDGSEDGYLRPGIVHRLDKDTTGVVVMAKNTDSLAEMKRMFSSREINKKYWALLYGNLQERRGIIEKPITRAADYKKQKIAGGKTNGKEREAVTEYKVFQSFPGFDLVEAEPKTGRMHQIRVHFFSIGHPVVGDKKYISKKYKGRVLVAAKRQMLHAKELRFELFGKKYEFSCDIPADFSKCLFEAAEGGGRVD